MESEDNHHIQGHWSACIQRLEDHASRANAIHVLFRECSFPLTPSKVCPPISYHYLSTHLHRVPRYTAEVLTTWYNSTDPVHISRVLRYFLERTIMTLEILQEAETTTKNA
jgi:hypothetical protein